MALDKWLSRHCYLAIALTTTLCVAAFIDISWLRTTWQIPLFAASIAVIGIPHGGLDHLFGRSLCMPRVGRWWPVVFFGGYLFVAVMVLAGWFLASPVVIALFFAMSAIHFGEGQLAPAAVLEGAMVIFIPFLAQPDEACRLLSWVIPGGSVTTTEEITRALRPALWSMSVILLARVGWLAWRGVRGRDIATIGHASRLTSFAAMFATVPVVVGFMVFFCGWHSSRELAVLSSRANPDRPLLGLVRVLRSSAWLSLIVVVAMSLAAWWGVVNGEVPDHAVVQAIFVGLSMVAIPHMVLHANVRRMGIDAFNQQVGTGVVSTM